MEPPRALFLLPPGVGREGSASPGIPPAAEAVDFCVYLVSVCIFRCVVTFGDVLCLFV